jgi:carbon storage regulator
MLVLNRRQGECIIIDGDIEIRVLEAYAGKAKIGIKAPEKVSIHREEVYQRMQGEQKLFESLQERCSTQVDEPVIPDAHLAYLTAQKARQQYVEEFRRGIL